MDLLSFPPVLIPSDNKQSHVPRNSIYVKHDMSRSIDIHMKNARFEICSNRPLGQ